LIRFQPISGLSHYASSDAAASLSAAAARHAAIAMPSCIALFRRDFQRQVALSRYAPQFSAVADISAAFHLRHFRYFRTRIFFASRHCFIS